jgi:hypothetical protein
MSVCKSSKDLKQQILCVCVGGGGSRSENSTPSGFCYDINVSGQLNIPTALSLGKEPTVRFGQETGRPRNSFLARGSEEMPSPGSRFPTVYSRLLY